MKRTWTAADLRATADAMDRASKRMRRYLKKADRP